MEENSMAIFKGAGVAIVTPMYDNGEVNYEQFARLVEFQIANGTDAIIVCGTTGEASTLTHEEHLDVIRYCVKVVDGRVPVIAGTGSNCTNTAVYLSREAEAAGADGLLVVSPYYNKATQKGLYAHFKTIADSVKIPIILYNIPGRTGCNILPETIVRLCKEVENIVGVKEATGDISQVSRLAALADGAVDIYSGEDGLIVPIMALGGLGVISVLSNVLDYCVEKNLPCVLCTTGLSEAQLGKVDEAAESIAVLKSANMSLGINLLLKLLKDAAAVLAPAGYDMEIVEKHHNQKLDAPSGTALALAETINEELGHTYDYVYDRSVRREKRPEKEIGISAVRGGTIVGEHDVIFAGMDEVITFSHMAYSRGVFGKGAVQAAKFLAGKPAGKYDMSHVIGASQRGHR